MKLSGARILIESLVHEGVDTIFGYPGSAVLNIYDELYKCKGKIRHVLVSHEQHAAHAADGYARSSGRTGVCLATSGPGATNLVTGIATAFVDSIPIVAITGNVGLPLLGKDSFQEVDIAGITMPIVKHNWIVEDVRELADIIHEAFFVARTGRPGPVLVDIPKDVSSALCEYKKTPKKGVTPGARALRLLEKINRETFNEEDIKRAAFLVNDSKRPMIYAGGGVIHSGAAEELKTFAQLINAPVALSLMGMGAFPAEHNLCTGLIGMHGTAASGKAVQKTDLLIAIGARFSDRVTGAGNFAKKAKIIHIDIDPAEINKNISADATITGDIKTVLDRLVKRITAKNLSKWNEEINKLKAIKQKSGSKKKSLHPHFVIRETAKALGEKTIVVTDVGQHQMWSAQAFPFKNARTFLSSGGMGTMGYGMGAAVGAKIANIQAPVVLFTGDGCFRMDSAEMATMVKEELAVLILIFNNSALGMLRQWQNFLYKSYYSQTDLDKRGPDFVKLAQAYNVEGFRVTDEDSFSKTLKNAVKLLSEKKPVLIEACIDKDEKVLPMELSKALK